MAVLHSTSMPSHPRNEMTLHIELGPLTWASNAMPGYYHVQDPSSREVRQIMVVLPDPWYRRALFEQRRVIGRMPWLKPASGVVAAVVCLGAVGLAQHWRDQAVERTNQAKIDAIPSTQPGAPKHSNVNVVALPYGSEPSATEAGFEKSLPLAQPGAQASPSSVIPMAPVPEIGRAHV